MRVTPFDWMLNMLPDGSKPPKKPLATWVSTWWFKGLVALSMGFGGYFYGEWKHEKGLHEGMLAIVQLCGQREGMLIDQDNGYAAICAPLPKVPKEERPRLQGT